MKQEKIFKQDKHIQNMELRKEIQALKDENEKINNLVKEICSDITLFGDFLAKCSLYIYLTTNSTKTKIEFETTKTKDGKVFTGEFRYKEVKK